MKKSINHIYKEVVGNSCPAFSRKSMWYRLTQNGQTLEVVRPIGNIYLVAYKSAVGWQILIQDNKDTTAYLTKMFQGEHSISSVEIEAMKVYQRWVHDGKHRQIQWNVTAFV